MPLRIEDYAVIGDTQTAALVGRNGSIDWLCLPRFDSGACFAALLGTPDHGRWLIAPADPVQKTRRRYRDGTLVLETEFETATGVVRLVDCMPPRGHDPDVVRLVEGAHGEVRMRAELTLRFDYGSIVPWVRRTADGISAVGGPDALCLHAAVPTRGEGFKTISEFVVRPGDRVPFVLTWHPSHTPAPAPLDAAREIEETGRWWAEWSHRCAHGGTTRDVVLRSLMVLKALTYAPTGGIVAAPTTSLPEWPGGVRNWDYRYCWLRDATLTLYALLIGGYTAEAEAWRDWLLRAVAGDPGDLQIMYGVAGERRLPESELTWLPGHENSRPVRVGNAAVRQLQLDVYGEVMDTLYQARKVGIESDKWVWRLQIHLLETLERTWTNPDEGIWEVRGPRRHFTHSKVFAWVAFDRAVKSVEQYGLTGPVDRWRAIRAAIHEDVCRRGFNREKNAFTQSYGSDALDASVLLLPLVGFLPATDPRIVGTIAAIERELVSDGLVRRYNTGPAMVRASAGLVVATAGPTRVDPVDGLPPGEGVFLACSFWLVDNYVLMGRRDDAERLFERLVGLANDVGLLAEEYDPVSKRQLGNFPQAFSHLSFVNTAYNLTRGREAPVEHRRT
jgi:GH15 family glucan-1,4-alpha-glucosidase